ncbi:hypothetical protein L7F22_004633 [Adiantum nelumboides]|nr:hypothetical protein [Adiantum nelumboides]
MTSDAFEDSSIVATHKEASQILEPTKKHHLEHAWTIWFDNTGKTKQSSWGSALHLVYTFSTVEDFWCLYNNVIQPSKLISPRNRLSLFQGRCFSTVGGSEVCQWWKVDNCLQPGKVFY